MLKWFRDRALSSAERRRYDALNKMYYGGSLSSDPLGVFGSISNFQTGANRHNSINYQAERYASRQLWYTNHLAHAVIERMVQQVINDGLRLNVTPVVSSMEGDELQNWSLDVKDRFNVWANSTLVDYERRFDFGKLQQDLYRESLLDGDALVVLRYTRDGLPQIQIVGGRFLTKNEDVGANGNRIVLGVEIDPRGRHVAFHVDQEGGDTQRILARGARLGRATAFLSYGMPPAVGGVRAIPSLFPVVPLIKQLGDATQSELLAARINASISTYIMRAPGSGGTSSFLSGGGIGGGKVGKLKDSSGNQVGELKSIIPGQVLNRLAPGEEPKSFDTKRPNVNFAEFESFIVARVAMAFGMAPELLRMEYQRSFTSSRAANLESDATFRLSRHNFAGGFLRIIQNEWLHGSIQNGTIPADGYLKAKSRGDIYAVNGWLRHDWIGRNRPHLDPLKSAKAQDTLINQGAMTREQAALDTNGSGFAENAEQLTSENRALAGAREPSLGAINTSKAVVLDKKDDEDDEE